MRALLTTIRGAVFRRRLQSVVVGVVALLSTATAVIGVGLLVVSGASFDAVFARQSGSHATASFDPAAASRDALAATAGRPGVTAAAGPFDTATVDLSAGSWNGPDVMLVGRAEQDGPVDNLTVDSGQWLTGPGQIVLSRDRFGPRAAERFKELTVGVPGSPRLRVVGVADSITGTADAWIWPSQDDVLRAATGATLSRQMLYRFAAAGDQAAVRDSLATATADLPSGALLGSSSYLESRQISDSSTRPIVPFVVAFAVLGLVMSVFIVANVVSGAVVAGYRTIGVVKALGFGPGQVVALYTGQVLAPALLGCLAGVALGNVLALPILADTQQVFDVAVTGLPPWVSVVVGLGLLAVVAAAALAPAWRAGRFPSVQALSVGRAPRTGRGYRVRRWLASTRLPRPVSFGLGTPFARPARSAVTLLAIVLGAATVVFGFGLGASLTRVTEAFSRTDAVPVVVFGRPPGRPDLAALRATIDAQPGTGRVVGVLTTETRLAAGTQPVEITGYDGDATWTGIELISGRWYTGPDEVVVASRMLRLTGTAVGQTLTLDGEQGRRQVRIVGEMFDNDNDGYHVVGPASVVTDLTGRAAPSTFEIGLTAGTDPASYARSLEEALRGQPVHVEDRTGSDEQQTITIMLGLVTTLTLLLTIVAAVGVFNTVVLNTRERVHEIGVLKTIGMTPRQVSGMVVTSMIGIGVLAGAIAVPFGFGLHRVVLPAMGDSVGTGVPEHVLDVYPPLLLAALGLAGILIAATGALVPAGWAARTRVATALRAE